MSIKDYDPSRLVLLGLIISPFILLGLISLMGEYQNSHPELKPKLEYGYKYKPRIPDTNINYKTPLKKGEPLMVTYTESGVKLVLKNGAVVYTGLSSEELLNQLSLDYQDLYDYYGGADELY